MMPIVNTLMGDAKSVAHSYSQALDALIPAKATDVTLATLCGENPKARIFGKSMELLGKKVQGTSMTVVEVYRQKELAWEKECTALEDAQEKLAQKAKKLYRSGSKDYAIKQQQLNDDWNKENYPSFKARIHAAYMDWLINGFKQDVDFAFGVIDDSSMARIEVSKEAMRNSAIQDPNSDEDLYGVSLSPKQWATFCKDKVERSRTDIWTEISFDYSPSHVQSIPTGNMEAGCSVGYGLWSIQGAYAHDEAIKALQSEMAACDVKISFSALVVGIKRPWMYSELFSDPDLEVAEGVKISPGPVRIQEMIEKGDGEDIHQPSLFPAYPTAFIITANTTIEFMGPTKAIQVFWRSGGEKLDYGPWSVKAGESLGVEPTATGCTISFGTPQVICWVSQIIPALPRPFS
ncbi:hypothetical protein F53441_11222 [Fusarium austroafricanum]|uniref:Uncharacterized protein n=1 Tax=Fusarium austroafricanum TaxID=2364996 RepID=A0A8H4NMS6_9HYPO|nr:hypothetical protein F53441_11222 [Fusarium austroafricanum]